MSLLDRWRRGVEPGDFAPDDEHLDSDGWYREEQRDHDGLIGVQGLASAYPGVVDGGRIRWDKVLAGFQPSGRVQWADGWQRRGAPVMDSQPAAILWHWTAGKPTATRPTPSLTICRDGRPAGKGVTAVPGPLVHMLVGYDGSLHVLASGRANHAGTGHQALIAEMRAGKAPRGSAARLGLVDTGGSGGALVGVEIENDGKAPFTDAQVDTCARFARACFRLGLGRNQAIMWTHGQWTRRKVDILNGQHQRLIDAYDAWKPLA